MRDFRDAKAMAQTLRGALNAKSVFLTHSESLELVAQVLGFRDWNVLSARIQSDQQATAAALGSTGSCLPVVPLRDVVFFPQMIAPLLVGRQSTKKAVESAMTADKRFVAVTQRRVVDDSPGPNDLYGVGVIASIMDLTTLADGTLRLVAKGLERAAIVHLAEGQFLTAEISAIEQLQRQEADSSLIRTVFEKFQVYRNATLPSPLQIRLPHISELSEFADAIAPLLSTEIHRRQDLLETSDVTTRLEKIIAIIEGRQAA
jgi:uncharacterized protein